jgi:hypothetical protein
MEYENENDAVPMAYANASEDSSVDTSSESEEEDIHTVDDKKIGSSKSKEIESDDTIMSMTKDELRILVFKLQKETQSKKTKTPTEKKPKGAPREKKAKAAPREKKTKAPPKEKKIIAPPKEKDEKANHFKDIETISPKPYNIHNPAEKKEAINYYKKHGTVIIMPFKSEEERREFCEACVTEIWNNIIDSAGYKTEIKEEMPYIKTQQDLDDFMGVLPDRISKHLKKLLGDHMFFHQGFGATCYNTSWHSKSAWKMRMDMLVVSFAQLLMKDGEEAYFSIDRTISKWLNEGESEFMHVDTSLFATKDDGDVQGKFCATEGCMILTPGSHLLTEEIKLVYPAIYPNAKPSDKKFALNPTADDPLNIFGQCKKMIVPAGCLVFWHDKVFHGVAKNKTGRVHWGFYLGFTNHIHNEGNDYHKSGKTQVQDRYDSWRHGVRPLAHPSCDPTHLYPNRFMNMHGILKSFIDKKMDKSNPQFDFSNRITAAGKSVTHLQENADVNYKAYPLSVEGRAFLVGKHNVEKFEWEF